MHLAVRLVFVLTALFVSACGDSPTAPTQRTLQVAGTYAGPIVFRVDGRAILSGSAEVQVEQSGSRLTITGVLSVTITGVLSAAAPAPSPASPAPSTVAGASPIPAAAACLTGSMPRVDASRSRVPSRHSR